MQQKYCHAMQTCQQKAPVNLNRNEAAVILFTFFDSDDPMTYAMAYLHNSSAGSARGRDVSKGRPPGIKYGPPGGQQYDNLGAWLNHVVFEDRNFERASLEGSDTQEWFKVHVGPGKGQLNLVANFVRGWQVASPLNTWSQQSALFFDLAVNVFPQECATPAWPDGRHS